MPTMVGIKPARYTATPATHWRFIVTERLHLAVAAYLARYRGLSRQHTASDLPILIGWCAERDFDPLAAQRTWSLGALAQARWRLPEVIDP
jgi:hypothetical protein